MKQATKRCWSAAANGGEQPWCPMELLSACPTPHWVGTCGSGCAQDGWNQGSPTPSAQTQHPVLLNRGTLAISYLECSQ